MRIMLYEYRNPVINEFDINSKKKKKNPNVYSLIPTHL